MRDKIIQFLSVRIGDQFGRRRLARYLAVEKGEYASFRRELGKLVKEGKVVRARRGYTWVGDEQRVTGKLVCNQKGFGFVLMEDEEDVFVSSRNLRGAIHGDTVEASLLHSAFGRRREGAVTRVIQRGTNEFIGTVVYRRDRPFLEIDPVTPRRGIRIVDSSAVQFEAGDVIRAKVQRWGEGRQPVQVEGVKIIGSIDNPEDDMKIICHKFDLDPLFPTSVRKEATRWSPSHIEAEISKRLDLRRLPSITIDPMDSRDFDDAISLQKDGEGNSIVGVHIADVSFFVPRGSDLDREARTRGTSVYFAEGVVHMLPEKLSAELCSLRPGEDRLAITVFFTVTPLGDITDASFHRSVIRNHRRFTYREVQSILDGEQESSLTELLQGMKAVSLRLLQKRRKRGSIDFDIPEPIFRFRERGMPHEIHPSERLDSHRIVEEFMLLANRVVAEKVPRTDGSFLPFIYRIHDRPPTADVEQFLTVLDKLGLYKGEKRDVSSSQFRAILASVEDSPFKQLIENLALRTMTKAVYSTNNRGHYGLAFDRYTHFTSPIRRYPDLVIHRLLKSYLFSDGSTRWSIEENDLRSIAKGSTEAEIKAMEAEREYIRLKQIRWLSRHIGEKFDGIISGVVASGFFVELKDTMVEGFVSADWLDDDYYSYVEEDFALIGRTNRRKFRMGDHIQILVRDVIIEKRQANFVVVP